MKDGKYNFDASKLGQAHGWCQRGVREAMEMEVTPLVVSNTSMTKWEVEPYLSLASEFGYEVIVYKIKGPWDAKLFAARNAHNVPLSVVQKQISKYQPIEGEIFQSFAFIESVEVQILESQPPQVNLIVSGYHSDGCEYPTEITQRQEGSGLYVEIYRTMPLAVMCPAMILSGRLLTRPNAGSARWTRLSACSCARPRCSRS
jgi:hypothetical protein